MSYIQIETESIRDANDKMMISLYCLKYLRDVEWYIELLRVGSEKYIVPHSLSDLESIRSQLKNCHEQILRVKIAAPKSQPFMDIQYPKRYEG